VDNTDVRIVDVKPMRVASVCKVGLQPELRALDFAIDWSNKHHIRQPHLWGFDVEPYGEQPTDPHGYEVWVEVGVDAVSDDTVTVKTFDGGLYAVMRAVGTGHIWQTWQRLLQWVESSADYEPVRFQELEEHVAVDLNQPEDRFVLDLYLPIRER
jgi:DNA gyrase inhibitor GyrI